MSLINDVREELSNLGDGRKKLRQFSVTMLIAAAVIFYLTYPAVIAAYVISVLTVYFLIALFIPKILRPFYFAWMGLAFVMGWFMSRLILTIIFYLVMTPIGLILKLSGKSLLDKSAKNISSYWVKKSNTIDYSKMS